AIANPMGFHHVGEFRWGITASDGPGNLTCIVDGVERTFYDYIARGAPYGPDDGTLAPWAGAASLPFAPELVARTLCDLDNLHLKVANPYGFKASFNPAFAPTMNEEIGWVSSYHFGINEGPTVLMIENHRTGLVWSLMKKCPYLVAGLRAASFSGGWLG
ncbi:MAG: glucoamylase family protein, partial [Caldimonas sp.]